MSGTSVEMVKEYNHVNYKVKFHKIDLTTTVTDSPDVADQWIYKVLNEKEKKEDCKDLAVGLCIGWKSCCLIDHDRHHRIATINLCFQNRCLIFQVLRLGYLPPRFQDFLSQGCCKFVGVEIDDHSRMLQEDWGVSINQQVDLEIFSKRRDIGLRALAYEILDVDVCKPVEATMTDWEARRLTPIEVQYASIDALLCFEIGKKKRAGLVSRREHDGNKNKRGRPGVDPINSSPF